MSLPALILVVLGCLSQIIFQPALAHGALIPPPAGMVNTDGTVGTGPAYCNELEGWVGDGIVRRDCGEAIREFGRTNVQPRGRQEYEFLSHGVHRASHLPYIVTPRKYDYGTCVVTIVMMETFHPATLPGGHPQMYARSDIATFYNVLDSARSLSSLCVERKSEPQAGWSVTGAHDSIGVLLFRRGSVIDRLLRSGATTLISIINGTNPIELIVPPRPSNVISS